MPRRDAKGNEYIEVTYHGEVYHIPVDYIMNEHPGGPAEIMDYEDKDITEAFIDQGHSIDAEMEIQQWLAKKSTHVDDVLDPDSAVPDREAALRQQDEEADREADRKAETDAWRRRNTLLALAGGVAAAAAAVAVIAVLRRQRE